MSNELSPEELAEVKGETRKMCEEKLKELGHDGFMEYLVDQLCQAGRLIADLEERLRLGRGLNV
ncbi:MAG: hypothetical protein AAB358_00070 [Patescibacteria group bacterium]